VLSNRWQHCQPHQRLGRQESIRRAPHPARAGGWLCAGAGRLRGVRAAAAAI
jgi:hypothetical protein